MGQLFSNLVKKVKTSIGKGRLKQAYAPTSPLKDCYNTTLAEFIDMVCDGKWAHSSEDWANVADQYAELSKDGNVTAIFKLQRDMAVLVNKCRIAEEIINSLDLSDNPDLWKVLKRLGIMAKNLDAAKSQAKRFVHDLAELQKELNKFVSDKKTTRADFDAKLVVLGKSIYRIDPKTTTIAEYCAVNNRYNAEQAALQQQNEKTNGRRFNK